MKRMTAEEVAGKLERLATVWRSVNIDRSIAHKDAACDVRDNLVPQWQDEPTENGWYYLRCSGVNGPPVKCEKLGRGRWMAFCGGTWIEIDCQVCPIGARPQ